MFERIDKNLIYSVLFGSILCTILGFLTMYYFGNNARIFVDLGKAFMEKELSPLNFALVLVIPTFTFFLVYSGVLFTFYFESVEEEKNMVRVSKKIKKRRKNVEK